MENLSFYPQVSDKYMWDLKKRDSFVIFVASLAVENPSRFLPRRASIIHTKLGMNEVVPISFRNDFLSRAHSSMSHAQLKENIESCENSGILSWEQ